MGAVDHRKFLSVNGYLVTYFLITTSFKSCCDMGISIYGSILTTKYLREQKTNSRATQSASQHLRAQRHVFVRAESDLCARKDRIVSVTAFYFQNKSWDSGVLNHQRVTKYLMFLLCKKSKCVEKVTF